MSSSSSSSSSVSGCLGNTCEQLGATWPELYAVTNDSNKVPATITFKYSFIIAGTTIADHVQGTGSAPAVDILDHQDGSVTNAQFKQEIVDALQEWKEVFEYLYPWLTLVFQNLGDETGTSVPSDPQTANYNLPSSENIGDIRFGMHNIDSAASTLAHGYSPGGTLGSIGNVGGDVHFDMSEDWRVDQTPWSVDAGAFSVKRVAAHELGHVFAILHSSAWQSLMYHTVAYTSSFDGDYPNGLKDSAVDLRCIECIWGEGQPLTGGGSSSSSSGSSSSSSGSSISSGSSGLRVPCRLTLPVSFPRVELDLRKLISTDDCCECPDAQCSQGNAIILECTYCICGSSVTNRPNILSSDLWVGLDCYTAVARYLSSSSDKICWAGLISSGALDNDPRMICSPTTPQHSACPSYGCVIGLETSSPSAGNIGLGLFLALEEPEVCDDAIWCGERMAMVDIYMGQNPWANGRPLGKYLVGYTLGFPPVVGPYPNAADPQRSWLIKCGIEGGRWCYPHNITRDPVPTARGCLRDAAKFICGDWIYAPYRLGARRTQYSGEILGNQCTPYRGCGLWYPADAYLPCKYLMHLPADHPLQGCHPDYAERGPSHHVLASKYSDLTNCVDCICPSNMTELGYNTEFTEAGCYGICSQSSVNRYPCPPSHPDYPCTGGCYPWCPSMPDLVGGWNANICEGQIASSYIGSTTTDLFIPNPSGGAVALQGDVWVVVATTGGMLGHLSGASFCATMLSSVNGPDNNWQFTNMELDCEACRENIQKDWGE